MADKLVTPFVDGKIKGNSGGGSAKAGKKAPKFTGGKIKGGK